MLIRFADADYPLSYLQMLYLDLFRYSFINWDCWLYFTYIRTKYFIIPQNYTDYMAVRLLYAQIWDNFLNVEIVLEYECWPADSSLI